RLFLDIRSSISQQRISDRGDLAFDNTTDTDNRTDVTTFSLVPRFNLPLGRFATVNATVSESQLQFSSDAVDSGRTQNVAVSVQNGSRFNKLNWDMSINQTRDYEAGSTLRDYQLGLAYRVRPKLRLTFSTGYEDSTLDTAADIPEDSGIWSVGAAWTIDRRQSLSASIGNRYNTQTYSLAYARQGRYGAIGVDYTETRTTSRAIQAEEFEVFDDNGEPIFSLLLPSITTEVFLQKTLSASFSWARARTSWSASASNETREFQLAGTTDEVFSLSGRLGYRFSDRISSSVSASWQEQSFGLDGRKDEILRLTLGTSFDLGRDMGVAFNLSHNERSSSDSTLNFDANTVSLGLTARF
ncbi:MAG: TIGR03016 family PEP-CTERM system-associated outer membrane protein, partial [Gammaproteobacteria bacterium]